MIKLLFCLLLSFALQGATITITHIEDSLYIENAPTEDEEFRNRLCSFFCDIDLCESREDIIFTDAGICIVKITGCPCMLSMYHAGFDRAVDNADCRYWCDRASELAQSWCATHFQKLGCQHACKETVNHLKMGCYWCCDGGGFYENCYKPFEDIVARMARPCDPLFD